MPRFRVSYQLLARLTSWRTYFTLGSPDLAPLGGLLPDTIAKQVAWRCIGNDWPLLGVIRLAS